MFQLISHNSVKTAGQPLRHPLCRTLSSNQSNLMNLDTLRPAAQPIQRTIDSGAPVVAVLCKNAGNPLLFIGYRSGAGWYTLVGINFSYEVLIHESRPDYIELQFPDVAPENLKQHLRKHAAQILKDFTNDFDSIMPSSSDDQMSSSPPSSDEEYNDDSLYYDPEDPQTELPSSSGGEERDEMDDGHMADGEMTGGEMTGGEMEGGQAADISCMPPLASADSGRNRLLLGEESFDFTEQLVKKHPQTRNHLLATSYQSLPRTPRMERLRRMMVRCLGNVDATKDLDNFSKIGFTDIHFNYPRGSREKGKSTRSLILKTALQASRILPSDGRLHLTIPTSRSYLKAGRTPEQARGIRNSIYGKFTLNLIQSLGFKYYKHLKDPLERYGYQHCKNNQTEARSDLHGREHILQWSPDRDTSTPHDWTDDESDQSTDSEFQSAHDDSASDSSFADDEDEFSSGGPETDEAISQAGTELSGRPPAPQTHAQDLITLPNGHIYDTLANPVSHGQCLWALLAPHVPGNILAAAAAALGLTTASPVQLEQLNGLLNQINQRLAGAGLPVLQIELDAFRADGLYTPSLSATYGQISQGQGAAGTVTLPIGYMYAGIGQEGHFMMRSQ